MLSCAGAYVLGVAGSNECPAGTVRIETEAECRIAAAARGLKLWGVWMYMCDGCANNWQSDPAAANILQNDVNWLRGCYLVTFYDRVLFNTHAVGKGQPQGTLLCFDASATYGAPQRRCARTRVCTGACVCRVRTGTCAIRACVCGGVGGAAAGRAHLCGLCGTSDSDGGAGRYGRGQYVYVR